MRREGEARRDSVRTGKADLEVGVCLTLRGDIRRQRRKETEVCEALEMPQECRRYCPCKDKRPTVQ